MMDWKSWSQKLQTTFRAIKVLKRIIPQKWPLFCSYEKPYLACATIISSGMQCGNIHSRVNFFLTRLSQSHLARTLFLLFSLTREDALFSGHPQLLKKESSNGFSHNYQYVHDSEKDSFTYLFIYSPLRCL